MKFVESASRKFNQIRKMNWSAPAIMSAFIVVCMIIIYGFELIGLANKEKNLLFRTPTPEKIIKSVSKNYEKLNKCVVFRNEIYMNKEEKIENIMRILWEGVLNQNEYIKNIVNNEKEFYDI